MKQLLKYGLALCAVVALAVLVFGPRVRAQNFQSGSNLVIAKTQATNGTLYAAGRTVDISGPVNGDVFCAGQDVTISAEVQGDIICAGQTVTITGIVHGNIRVAAQTLNFSGSVDHNFTAVGQTLTTTSASHIVGDATITGSDTTLDGAVGRDLVINGTTLAINTTIGRNVQANIRQLRLDNNARIGGNLKYTSSASASIAPGATIAGDISRTQPSVAHHTRWGIFPISLFGLLYLLLADLLLALILVLLMPKFVHQASQTAKKSLGKSLLTGLIGSFALFMLSLLVMFSVIGIPLGIVLGIIWLLMSILTFPFAGYYIGRLAFSHIDNAIYVMLLGTMLLVVASFVPLIGILVSFFGYWLGFGIILLTIKRQIGTPKYTVSKM